MAMFYKPPAPREVNPRGVPPLVELAPPPPVQDPGPWIEVVLPPEEDKGDRPYVPPEVVIKPVEVPPVIMPPPPDMTPPTIVPWEVELVAPPSQPAPPTEEDPGGSMGPVRAPPTLMTVAAGEGRGTFMVYLGKRLLLSMATTAGSRIAGMLIGPLGKMVARGVYLRLLTGISPGHYRIPYGQPGSAVSFEAAWRGSPQEFSYWEA